MLAQKDKIKNTSPLSIAVPARNSRCGSFTEVRCNRLMNKIEYTKSTLENAGKDFEKLKVVRSNVEGFSTINSYMQQFWAYLLSHAMTQNFSILLRDKQTSKHRRSCHKSSSGRKIIRCVR